MKKLLGIVVLGLLLISCDQSQDQKKSKKTPDFERALENCSDYNFEYYRKAEQERWEKKIENGNSDKKVKELVNYWKNFKKMPLSKKKTSKKRDAYMVSFNNCQLWWKQNPKKFKEKWL